MAIVVETRAEADIMKKFCKSEMNQLKASRVNLIQTDSPMLVP